MLQCELVSCSCLLLLEFHIAQKNTHDVMTIKLVLSTISTNRCTPYVHIVYIETNYTWTFNLTFLISPCKPTLSHYTHSTHSQKKRMINVILLVFALIAVTQETVVVHSGSRSSHTLLHTLLFEEIWSDRSGSYSLNGVKPRALQKLLSILGVFQCHNRHLTRILPHILGKDSEGPWLH